MCVPLLAAGSSRKIMPRGRVMIHEASSSTNKAQVSDFLIYAERLKMANEMVLASQLCLCVPLPVRHVLIGSFSSSASNFQPCYTFFHG
jgi:hypothetical protein